VFEKQDAETNLNSICLKLGCMLPCILSGLKDFAVKEIFLRYVSVE